MVFKLVATSIDFTSLGKIKHVKSKGLSDMKASLLKTAGLPSLNLRYTGSVEL